MSDEREAFESWWTNDAEGTDNKAAAFEGWKARADWQRSQQSAQAGYVMVPVEPPEAVLEILYDNGMDLDDQMLLNIWKWLLDAASAAPAAQGWIPVSDDARDALVGALEQITRMTYDEWTNGAVASRIAEEALAAYRAATGSK